MKSLFWLILGGVVVAAFMEQQNKAAAGQPLIPGIQPAGCLPGDPSISVGGKTYCLPQGVIPY
jgi:hypothetical protein